VSTHDTTATDAPAVTVPVVVEADPLERHRFKPGQSGNPTGRPKRERAYLSRTYGSDGRKVFERLELLRQDPKTPRRVKADIDKFIIERMFGRAVQAIGVEGRAEFAFLARRSDGPHGASREGGAVTLQDVAIDRLVRWKTYPPSFVRENFGVEPDPWQLEVLEAFPTKQRIASCASKGVGKSTLDAWLGLNFLATRPHANVAVT
jgi:hypothetical protein